MIIRESIQNFERGGDPLKKMGIGIGRKLEYQKAKKEISDLFKELCKKYHKKRSITWDIPPCDIHYIYANSFWWSTVVFFIKREEGVEGYEVGVERDTEELKVVPTIEEAREWIVNKIQYMKSQKMIESMDFERHKEPLDSMGIGKAALDKKIIEDTDWELPHDLIHQNFDIIEVIPEYKGNPILIMKTKSDGDGDGKRYTAMSPDYRTDYYDDPKLSLGEVKGYLDTRFNKLRDMIGPRNESQNFERSKDPIKNLGIGKKVLIENWLKEYDLSDCVINEDLTIDLPEAADTNLYLAKKDLTELPEFIQFRNVYGGFNIAENQLTSLRGCPIKVLESKNYKGNFKCFHNKLENLEFAPKRVDGAFICYSNPGKFFRTDVTKVCRVTSKQIWGEDRLKTNEGMNFERDAEPLDKLELGEHFLIKKWLKEMEVEDGDFKINSDGTIDIFGDINIVAKQLEELPKYINFNKIHGGFYAAHNKWKTLRGFPKEVSGDLSVYSEHEKGSGSSGLGAKKWKDFEIRSKTKIYGELYN